jgi:hypothetical protein
VRHEHHPTVEPFNRLSEGIDAVWWGGVEGSARERKEEGV